ncbi:putative WD repeat-containing protein alr3466 OS=Nostoc sp, (strain PCC 7120 / UTEX 2576) GN=alr3466 PE=4 SV=1 [Rhizoctonia solani AG-1 IB]|uniref:Putative WD repeat-containing protein alr3466 n=1 Tax=Thanatephorus cucumeris (strain AG1-IB / isolate 7/3/14) TaxID=1108050 RepID=A0A0B7G565_THACB|nr:putative WD repeat-containing protein alr3466 OS=Nostoc sp, (strain PCC 7120 / UTEX 2576) GN=alr3466 PE=4 SV=1 [Rhizoctonia solani AG-1 IB]
MSAIALPLHTDKHDPTPKAHPDEKNYEAILISKDPPLASNEGPIWPGLKALLKVLEASAELFGPVKLAMEGLNGCVRIYEEAAKERKEYDILRTNLNELLGDLAAHLESESTPMTGSIFRLCRVIVAEVDLMKTKQTRRVARYLAADLRTDSDDIFECYERIRDHVSRLVDSRLEKLKPSKYAAYNTCLSLGVSRGPCSPNTRLGEINKLLIWASQPDGEMVCWLDGMAGTGKTTIAYSLCRELEADGRLAASFFCSRAVDKCKDVRMILPTIAYQLAQFSYPFKCALSQALSGDPDAATRDLELQFKNLINEPLQKARRTFPPDSIVAIDALDECEDENATGKLLKAILSSSRDLPIRFFISSRPEPEIYKQMTSKIGLQAHTRLVLHELSSSTVQGDIMEYLGQELQDIPMSDFQRTGLVQQCGVLFIYASTIVRYIKDGYELEEHKERLDRILGLTASQSDNQEIDELYSIILGAAWNYSKFQNSNKSQMKALLDTIVCAQQPMTLEALAGLLELKDEKRVNALLRPLGSVIHIAEETGLVSTLHASFPDFLFNKHRSRVFSCDTTKHHYNLAEMCFKVIKSNPSQFNIADLKSSYELDYSSNMQVEEFISPHLIYACRHWAAHLLLGASENQPSLLMLLENFLSVHLLLWMEVLNLKRIMYEGVAIMQQIASWCQGVSSNLAELANDAWQFVSTYANHPVSQSTPHIYISMLAFWPSSRPVSTHYMSIQRRVPKPQGEAVTQRSPSLLATWSFDQPVNSTCFSPNGRWIILAAGTRVCILDRYTGQIMVDSRFISIYLQTVNSVTFSPDSSFALSGSNDGVVYRWTPEKHCKLPHPLIKHSHPIISLELSRDGSQILLNIGNNSVHIYAAHDGQLIDQVICHSEPISAAAFILEGAQFVCGSADKSLTVRDTQTGQAICESTQGHGDCISSITALPRDPIVISGSSDATIRVWSSQDGRTIKGPLKGHTSSISSLSVSPDGLYVASGSHDCTARIWDIQNGETVFGPLVGHLKAINSVSFSPEGTQLISGSQDGTLRLWNIQKNLMKKPGQSLTDSIRSARFSPDGKFVASGSEIGTIRLWDSHGGRVFGCPMKGHTDWIYSIDISSDAAYIVSGSKDKSIQLWDAKTGQNIHGAIEGHSGAVNSVRFSADGTQIVSGSDDHTVRLWYTKTGQPALHPLEGHTGAVLSVVFSPNGTQVASASQDGTIRTWDLRSGSYHRLLQGHSDFVVSLHFSPDGFRLASGSYDKSIIIWDVRTGDMVVGPLRGHGNWVTSVTFSADGNFLASGSYDCGICFWDPRDGRLIAGPLKGHTDYIEGVQFSPDSSRLLSCSSDRTIRFWEIEKIQSHTQQKLPQGEAQHPDASNDAEIVSSWELDADGWMVDQWDRKLSWVPPDLRSYLLRPTNGLIISDKGGFKMEFEGASIGQSWTECYSCTE